MKGLAKLLISCCNGKTCSNIVQTAGKEISHTVSPSIMRSTTNIRQRILQRIQDPELIKFKDSPLQFYTYIRDKFYANIRAGKKLIYKPRPNYNPKEFDNALDGVSNGFYGKVQESWKYRYPQNMDFTKPVTDRLSLNVYQDKELIQKLDTYLSKNCPNAHYKCAGAGNIGWNQRHDSVTIYFSNNLTPKVQQDIAKLAQPHIRANSSAVMLGNKISDGVYHIVEPTRETIKPLIIKAKLLNLEPEFYEWLGKPDFYGGAGLFVMKNGERVVHTSPGAVEALKQMLNMFEKI